MSKQMYKTSEYLLCLLVFSFAALLPLTKIADFDLFFHLRLGKHVWENMSLPMLDTYSYTYAGPQYVGEWLGNAVLYGAYKYGGFYGLGIIKAFLFSLLIFFIWKTLSLISPDSNFYPPLSKGERGGIINEGILAKVSAIVVFAYAIRFRLDLRPYYFTYIGLSIFIYIFMRYRTANKGLYWLIPVEIFWCNSHAGFIIGPLMLGLFLITESIRRRALNLSSYLPLILVILAGGINPEGFRPYLALMGFAPASVSSGTTEIGEWQSLTTHLLWGFGLRYTWGFQVLFGGALFYLIYEAFKKRLDLFMTAVFIGSAYYTVRHVRLMDISSILLIPVFYSGISSIFTLFRLKDSGRIAFNGVLSMLIIYLLIFSVFGSRIYSFGFGAKEGIFPEKALKFMDETNIKGNGFNTVTVGSYMLWQAPLRKVFIDGRLIQPAPVQDGYKKAIDQAEGFKELDEKYDFSYALIDYNPKSRWRFPLHMNSNPEWVLVYWDTASALYLKDNAENKDITNKWGYRVLRPSFNNFSYLDPVIAHLKGDSLKAVDHDILLNPDNQEAHLAKAYTAYYLGLPEVVLKELKTALELPPDTAFEHISMAQLLAESGDKAGAVKELQHALQLESYNKTARELLDAIDK